MGDSCDETEEGFAEWQAAMDSNTTASVAGRVQFDAAPHVLYPVAVRDVGKRRFEAALAGRASRLPSSYWASVFTPAARRR